MFTVVAPEAIAVAYGNPYLYILLAAWALITVVIIPHVTQKSVMRRQSFIANAVIITSVFAVCSFANDISDGGTVLVGFTIVAVDLFIQSLLLEYIFNVFREDNLEGVNRQLSMYEERLEAAKREKYELQREVPSRTNVLLVSELLDICGGKNAGLVKQLKAKEDGETCNRLIELQNEIETLNKNLERAEKRKKNYRKLLAME